MRENSERLAWTVMLISFFVFCLLVVSIPLGIRQFVITATKSHTARVTAYYDAVLVNTDRGDESPIIKDTESDREIYKDTTLTTTTRSQAFVRLFEGSNLQVWNNSQMTLVESRTPRFRSSSRSSSIVIKVQSGKVRVGVAPLSQDRPRQFQVRTPHGVILLEEGSYSINVTDSETQVSVRTVREVGHATLEAAGESISLELGERGRIEAGRTPEGPLPAKQNLLVNGDFQQPLSIGWIYEESHDKKEAAGSASIEATDDRQVVHFVRRGGNQQHAENRIEQELDLDVRDASSLEIHLNAKLVFQSLSGGGYRSSEYPLTVRLRYHDANGAERDWVRGFYYTNWEDRDVNDDESNRGILIPQNVWRPFESENLMLSLGDQKPTHLISLSVYASGHDYESMVSDVGLFVKE